MIESGCAMKSELKMKKTVAAETDRDDFSKNVVELRGRISGLPVERELPSGDKVVEFRLIVTRESRNGVDTLDIGAWTSKARRKCATLHEGEWVEISGSVHRRFWQSATGVASRWQIEACEITRL